MIITIKLIAQKVLLCKLPIFFLYGFLIFNVNNQFLNAQEISKTASSSISATIIKPIGITKTNDMKIGNMVVTNSQSKITLEPTAKRKVIGGNTLPLSTKNVNPASFNVTGEAAYTYSITIPSSVSTLTYNMGSEIIQVNNFTCSPKGAGMLSSGAQTIFVGATISLGESFIQNENKDNPYFDVIINYN